MFELIVELMIVLMMKYNDGLEICFCRGKMFIYIFMCIKKSYKNKKVFIFIIGRFYFCFSYLVRSYEV